MNYINVAYDLDTKKNRIVEVVTPYKLPWLFSKWEFFF